MRPHSLLLQASLLTLTQALAIRKTSFSQEVCIIFGLNLFSPGAYNSASSQCASFVQSSTTVLPPIATACHLDAAAYSDACVTFFPACTKTTALSGKPATSATPVTSIVATSVPMTSVPVTTSMSTLASNPSGTAPAAPSTTLFSSSSQASSTAASSSSSSYSSSTAPSSSVAVAPPSTAPSSASSSAAPSTITPLSTSTTMTSSNPSVTSPAAPSTTLVASSSSSSSSSSSAADSALPSSSSVSSAAASSSVMSTGSSSSSSAAAASTTAAATTLLTTTTPAVASTTTSPSACATFYLRSADTSLPNPYLRNIKSGDAAPYTYINGSTGGSQPSASLYTLVGNRLRVLTQDIGVTGGVDYFQLSTDMLFADADAGSGLWLTHYNSRIPAGHTAMNCTLSAPPAAGTLSCTSSLGNVLFESTTSAGNGGSAYAFPNAVTIGSANNAAAASGPVLTIVAEALPGCDINSIPNLYFPGGGR